METVFKEERLINEYGSDYGMHITVYAVTQRQADIDLCERYGENRVYGSHDVWDQFRYEVILPE